MQVKEAAEVARDGVSIDEMMKQASARRMLMLELLESGFDSEAEECSFKVESRAAIWSENSGSSGPGPEQQIGRKGVW